MTMENIHEAPETVEVHGEKSDGSKLGIFINILKRYLSRCWCSLGWGLNDG